MKEKKIFSVEGLVREYYLKLTDTKASPRLEARKMVFLESCLKDEYSSYFNIRNCVSSVWTIPLQGYIHRTSFSLFALSPRKNFKSAASESYWWFIICTQGITLHCEDIYENINHNINFCLLGIAFAPSRINRSPLWTIRAYFFQSDRCLIYVSWLLSSFTDCQKFQANTGSSRSGCYSLHSTFKFSMRFT